MARLPSPSNLMSPDSWRRKEREKTEVKTAGRATPPDWLSDNAKKWFKKILKQLPDGVATRIDSDVLALAAEALDEYHQLGVEIKALGAAQQPATSGKYIYGRDGGVVLNPLFRERKEMANRFIVIAKEFGLTPVARARISIANQISDEASLDLE